MSEQLLTVVDVAERLDRIEALLKELTGNGKAGYTPAEFAERLGKAPFTVREWCRHGRLNAFKTSGDDWRIPRDEVERYEREGLLDVKTPDTVRRRIKRIGQPPERPRPDEIDSGDGFEPVSTCTRMFGPGIYFLFDKTELVYIGKARNLASRIYRHQNQGTKVFDSVSVKFCTLEELRTTESKLIERFKPKYNIMNNQDAKDLRRLAGACDD